MFPLLLYADGQALAESVMVIGDVPGLGVKFVMFVLVALLIVALWRIYDAANAAAPAHRTMNPTMVWLLLIPVFNAFWNFKALPAVSNSLAATLRDKAGSRRLWSERWHGVGGPGCDLDLAAIGYARCRIYLRRFHGGIWYRQSPRRLYPDGCGWGNPETRIRGTGSGHYRVCCHVHRQGAGGQVTAHGGGQCADNTSLIAGHHWDLSGDGTSCACVRLPATLGCDVKHWSLMTLRAGVA